MQSSPLVSVVLCTYNGAVYLEEQLRSVQAQTWSDLEIIVVDDGSTDNTVAILREYASRDPRINIYINEHNLGLVLNFEKGCSLSKGKWIALCDQDDYWFPEKIEKMVNAIGDHPMAYCDSLLCDQDLQDMGKCVSDLVHYEDWVDARQLCIFTRTYGHSTLFTRELFDKACPFRKEIPHDGWMAFNGTLYGGVKYIPEALVKYRQHAGNVSGVIGRKWKKKKPPLMERKRAALARARNQLQTYYDICPDGLVPQKKLLRDLLDSYRSFSPWNNTKRMILYFTNYKRLLVVKRYSTFRKYLFCLKMFIIIK